MKRAFTLIELLVVIGIIGVLASVMIAALSGGTEAASAAKCMANLSNLARAWGGERAGSQENLFVSVKTASSGGAYYEAKGWISSNTRGLYSTKSGDKMISESHQTFQPISLYEKDDDLAKYAYTNGWMAAKLGHDVSCFVCPRHSKVDLNRKVRWSYFMSAYFGWDAAQGGHTYISVAPGCVVKREMTNADHVLLFAEIPFKGPSAWMPGDSATGTDGDAILQYDGCNKATAARTNKAVNGHEHIGFNHKSGKNWFAHVAFADGHVEKLAAPKDPANMVKLTTYLCTGESYSFNGKQYERLDE